MNIWIKTQKSPYLFSDNIKPGYVICAPDYTENSAGIRCLYMLCDLLNKQGYDSYIAYSNHTTNLLNAPLISISSARKKVRIENYIAVYPEIIIGNPLGARKVVRWVLNKPGFLGGDEVYNEEECVFVYSKFYVPYVKNKIDGMLFMPTIDENIFHNNKNTANTRSLQCYYVGKSSYINGYFDKNKVFEITRTTPHKKDLGKLFRSSNLLYCFDNCTALIFEAILCGCPVVIIPDGNFKKSDFEKSELGVFGVAMGIEELDFARQTVDCFSDHYKTVKQEFEKQFLDFINITQSVLPREKDTNCEHCKILYRELEDERMYTDILFENYILKVTMGIQKALRKFLIIKKILKFFIKGIRGKYER
ncbi:MAG: hypothetical protein C0412_09135 [Flavobacterium sp.]|nr:hypothetical protein [Flavobacterium sp.]